MITIFSGHSPVYEAGFVMVMVSKVNVVGLFLKGFARRFL